VTNIIFNFETSPNTKPKDKKVGRHGTLCPPVWKSGWDTSPVFPTKLHPWTALLGWFKIHTSDTNL